MPEIYNISTDTMSDHPQEGHQGNISHQTDQQQERQEKTPPQQERHEKNILTGQQKNQHNPLQQQYNTQLEYPPRCGAPPVPVGGVVAFQLDVNQYPHEVVQEEKGQPRQNNFPHTLPQKHFENFQQNNFTNISNCTQQNTQQSPSTHPQSSQDQATRIQTLEKTIVTQTQYIGHLNAEFQEMKKTLCQFQEMKAMLSEFHEIQGKMREFNEMKAIMNSPPHQQQQQVNKSFEQHFLQQQKINESFEKHFSQQQKVNESTAHYVISLDDEINVLRQWNASTVSLTQEIASLRKDNIELRVEVARKERENVELVKGLDEKIDNFQSFLLDEKQLEKEKNIIKNQKIDENFVSLFTQQMHLKSKVDSATAEFGRFRDDSNEFKQQTIEWLSYLNKNEHKVLGLIHKTLLPPLIKAYPQLMRDLLEQQLNDVDPNRSLQPPNTINSNVDIAKHDQKVEKNDPGNEKSEKSEKNDLKNENTGKKVPYQFPSPFAPKASHTNPPCHYTKNDTGCIGLVNNDDNSNAPSSDSDEDGMNDDIEMMDDQTPQQNYQHHTQNRPNQQSYTQNHTPNHTQNHTQNHTRNHTQNHTRNHTQNHTQNQQNTANPNICFSNLDSIDEDETDVGNDAIDQLILEYQFGIGTGVIGQGNEQDDDDKNENKKKNEDDNYEKNTTNQKNTKNQKNDETTTMNDDNINIISPTENNQLPCLDTSTNTQLKQRLGGNTSPHHRPIGV